MSTIRLLPCAAALVAASALAPVQAATVSPYGLTFTLDPATTAVGTWEAEGGLNVADAFRSTPVVLKYSPWQDYEFGLSGELYSATDGATGWDGEFGGSVATFILRHPFHKGDWTLGVAPRVTLFTDAPGEEYGIAFLAMHAVGNGGVTANAGYSHATDPAADRIDLAADYYHPLGSSGRAAQMSWFLGATVAMPDAGSDVTSVGAGLTYRPQDTMEFDLAVRSEDVGGADAWRLLLNLVVNFGE